MTFWLLDKLNLFLTRVFKDVKVSSDAMRCALIGCGEMILLADGKNPKQLIIVMSKMNAYMLLQMATINNVYIYIH